MHSYNYFFNGHWTRLCWMILDNEPMRNLPGLCAKFLSCNMFANLKASESLRWPCLPLVAWKQTVVILWTVQWVTDQKELPDGSGVSWEVSLLGSLHELNQAPVTHTTWCLFQDLILVPSVKNSYKSQICAQRFGQAWRMCSGVWVRKPQGRSFMCASLKW